MSSTSAHELRNVEWAGLRDSLVRRHGGEPPAVCSPLFSAHGIVHAFWGRSGQAEGAHHVKQVHGTHIVAADASTDAQAQERTRADGVFTLQRGQRVAVKTADCVPIICCDRETRHFALAVHAGRRGLLAGIVKSAVDCLAAQGFA